ncbi:hypothetical protein F4X73_05505 [Candidatus Poribacteria bacterium]|nr:hypothetical protein [Candidatus Poribacteria bacterium]
MKKQITYLIIVLVAVLTSVAFYMNISHKNKEKLLDRIPVSKPHQHVSSNGKVIEHIHRQITPPVVNVKTTDNETEISKHPILRIWENLDLTTIRRKYQPYTVSEIMDKWEEKYINFEYPPYDNIAQHRLAQLEKYWPKEKWLQHLMDLGHPLHDVSSYKLASDLQGQSLFIYKRDYDNPTTRSDTLDAFNLPIDATWQEVEDLNIKFNIVARIKKLRAKEADPSVYGGVTNLQGVFTPFSPNTVYVHVSDDKPLSTFTGVMLSEQQKEDLRIYGVAPKGVTVVYTDKDGNPLPADERPRFFERRMAVLEAAEKHIEQMIVDHDAIFKTLSEQPQKETQKEQTVPSHQSQPNRSVIPEFEDTKRRSVIPMQKRNIPPEMLPPIPPSRANIQQWFEILQELHGGELPKDLRVLQEVVNELEAIRRVGEKKLPPRGTPPVRRPPDPVAPPPQ